MNWAISWYPIRHIIRINTLFLNKKNMTRRQKVSSNNQIIDTIEIRPFLEAIQKLEKNKFLFCKEKHCVSCKNTENY